MNISKIIWRIIQLEPGTFAPVRYSGFEIRFRYVFAIHNIFSLKYFQGISKHSSNETYAKRKIPAQPIIFSTCDALNYRKFLGKTFKNE